MLSRRNVADFYEKIIFVGKIVKNGEESRWVICMYIMIQGVNFASVSLPVTNPVEIG